MSVVDMSKMQSAKKIAQELGLDGPDDGALLATHLQAGSAEANAAGPRLAQEYGMVGQPASAAPVRDLQVIEGEIEFFKRTAGQSIIEIGKRLIEAKAQLRHGEWLPWLRDKVDISERSAQDFMRLAKEYSKSAEIADLGASKALALLGLPVSERADFVAEKHTVDGVEKSVSEMTAKELKRAIEERDDARRGMEAMKARAEVAEQSREKMEQDMRQLKELAKRAREAEEQKAAELLNTRAELEELKAKPVEVAVQVQDASAEQIAAAKKTAKAEAEKKHKAELAAKEDQLKKAQAELKKAREDAKTANVNLQNAEKRVAEANQRAADAGKMAQVQSSQSMVKFAILFQQTQDNVNRMAEAAAQESPENQAKIHAALHALAQAIEGVAAG